MKIPVVWLSYHEVDPPAWAPTVRVKAGGPRDLYWDQGQLMGIFDGTLWWPPGKPAFAHYTGFPNVELEGAVVVLPGRWHRDDLHRLNADLARLSWCLLILTGDEDATFPWQGIHHRNLRIWLQTPQPVDYPPEVYRLGNGWPPQCPLMLPEAPPDKVLSWFFAGQVTHPEREACVSALQAQGWEPGDNGMLVRTRAFATGLAQEEYYRRLSAAKIAPCPGGPATPDTFRFWEALEAGTVPVVLRDPYWPALFGEKPPFPQIGDWSGFSAICNDILAGWPRAANVVGAWWARKRREMAYRLLSDLEELGAMSTPADGTWPYAPSDLVTVLVPTSATPGCPSTEILETTIDSIRAQPGLERAEIIIMADGLRPEHAERAGAYEEYRRRLLWLAGRRWHNVLLLLFDEHLHQSGMLREALPEVRTPLILFVEHDTPLVGPINWPGLVRALRSGRANVIRLHHEDRILPDHLYLMPPPVEEIDVEGVPLLRTAQWSSRPHLARADFYRDLVDRYFGREARTFIEEVMHGAVDHAWREEGEGGWSRFRLWIYAPSESGPMGGIKRSTHLDARGGETQAPCVFAYDGPTPPGAPQPSAEREDAEVTA